MGVHGFLPESREPIKTRHSYMRLDKYFYTVCIPVSSSAVSYRHCFTTTGRSLGGTIFGSDASFEFLELQKTSSSVSIFDRLFKNLFDFILSFYFDTFKLINVNSGLRISTEHMGSRELPD